MKSSLSVPLHSVHPQASRFESFHHHRGASKISFSSLQHDNEIEFTVPRKFNIDLPGEHKSTSDQPVRINKLFVHFNRKVLEQINSQVSPALQACFFQNILCSTSKAS